MLAAQNGHLGYLNLLIFRIANVDIRTNDNWASLMVAVQFGHVDIVQALIEAKADVKRLNCDAAQGFLLHRPLPPEDIEKLLESS